MLPPSPDGEHASTDQKRAQATFTDSEVDHDYEVTRPHGTPVVHAEVLTAKLRRGIRGLEHVLAGGGSVLAVCGGSGMDAEFLARAGGQVVCTDISVGGAVRARERARRYGLALTSVVADAESLPFKDRSFDFVWVHDGLHHLERPERAIAEMVRVADKAISVNEPAQAALTAGAVRLGLAEAVEESGNQVARLRPEAVVEALRLGGFDVISAERYAQLYRHEAGPIYRNLSRRALAKPAIRAIAAIEELLAPMGNKLSVRGIRRL